MTEFEVGKQYKTDGGCTVEVNEIITDNPEDHFPVGFRIVGDRRNQQHWAAAKGRYFSDHSPHFLDLLLPAIEPEAVGFSESTAEALTRFRNLWRNFTFDIENGAVNPLDGHRWGDVGGFILCVYPSREAALSEAAQVIAAIDCLLEGGPAK